MSSANRPATPATGVDGQVQRIGGITMNMPPAQDRSMEPLGEDECFQLLQTTRLGRVALCVSALPAIFPIHFALLGRNPVFRTDPGTKLSAASAGQVVCLEIDDADPVTHAGWSVMVTGAAEILHDPADLAGARQLPLRPWVGRGDAFVRIDAALVSGRRIPVGHPSH